MDILPMEVYRKPSDTGSGYKLWCIALQGQQIVVRFGHEDHTLQERLSQNKRNAYRDAYRDKIDKKGSERYEHLGSYLVSDRVDFSSNQKAAQPEEPPDQPMPQPAKASARDGLLYWSINGVAESWLDSALRAIEPLVQASDLCVVVNRTSAVQELKLVNEQGSELLIKTKDGKGQGIVKPCEGVHYFTLALMAMAKAMTELAVVDDDGNVIRLRPKPGQTHLGAEWAKVEPVAILLGLVPSKEFMEENLEFQLFF